MGDAQIHQKPLATEGNWGSSALLQFQFHPPISSTVGMKLPRMKFWWNVLGKQTNHIDWNYIDEMVRDENFIDEIAHRMKLRGAHDVPFHWKPLGKQWNGVCSISSKTVSYRRKWNIPAFQFHPSISSMKLHQWNFWHARGWNFIENH